MKKTTTLLIFVFMVWNAMSQLPTENKTPSEEPMSFSHEQNQITYLESLVDKTVKNTDELNELNRTNNLFAVTFEGNCNKDSTVRFFGDGQNWVPSYFRGVGRYGNPAKQIFNYDDNGNQVLEIHYNWNSSVDMWEQSFKFESAYNSMNLKIWYAGYFWDTVSNMWKGTYRAETEYDVNGNETQRIDMGFDEDNNDWTGYLKKEYAYNSKGNLTMVIESDKQQDSDTWSKTVKNEFEYDTANNITTNTNYIWAGSLWEFESRNFYEYDNHNNILLREEYTWRTSNNDWILSEGRKYEYDTLASEIIIIRYKLDTATNNWELNFKWEYDYDANGNQIKDSYYHWVGIDSIWAKGEKVEYSFDKNDNKTLEAYYSSSINNEWIKDWKNEYSYNDANKLATTIYFNAWNNENNEWDKHYKTEHRYNEENYHISDLYYRIETADGDWMFYRVDQHYYCGVSDTIAEVPIANVPLSELKKMEYSHLIVYPNPAKSFISIALKPNERALFKLYDTEGRIHCVQKISEHQNINISKLKPGIYLYLINFDNRVQTGKIIKH